MPCKHRDTRLCKRLPRLSQQICNDRNVFVIRDTFVTRHTHTEKLVLTVTKTFDYCDMLQETHQVKHPKPQNVTIGTNKYITVPGCSASSCCSSSSRTEGDGPHPQGHPASPLVRPPAPAYVTTVEHISRHVHILLFHATQPEKRSTSSTSKRCVGRLDPKRKVGDPGAYYASTPLSGIDMSVAGKTDD